MLNFEIIHLKHLFKLIGKKGANIQMLRSEYSANIKLPDSPGPERIFSVYAADADTVADVIGILSKLFDSKDRTTKEV